MLRHKPRKSQDRGIFISLARSFVLIAVLSATVLGISFFVKVLATTPTEKYLSYLVPLLAKVNIKVDQEKAEQVAGDFVSRISQTEIITDDSVSNSSKNSTTPTVLLKIGLLADSHNNHDNLKSALDKLKTDQIATVIFLGDYTDLGVIADLENAKKAMDASGLTYYSLPGDHDLWKSVGPQNFIQVFGQTDFEYKLQDASNKTYKFVGMDNSANFTVLSQTRLEKFKQDIKDADFVFLSQPVYTTSNQRIMGIVDGLVTENVHNQALEILDAIQKSSVKAVVSGDLHQFSVSDDPVRSELKHIVAGALATDRNLQSPRYSELIIYSNDSFEVKDIVLE